MNNQHMIKTFEKDFSKFNHMISDAEKRQAEIDELKAEFFANGGKIQTAEHGEVKLDFSMMPALINEFTGKVDIERAERIVNRKKKGEIEQDLARFNTSKLRSKTKSPHGQNIKKTTSGKFQVSIANFHETFETEELARAARDHRRNVLGMPPAEY